MGRKEEENRKKAGRKQDKKKKQPQRKGCEVLTRARARVNVSEFNYLILLSLLRRVLSPARNVLEMVRAAPAHNVWIIFPACACSVSVIPARVTCQKCFCVRACNVSDRSPRAFILWAAVAASSCQCLTLQRTFCAAAVRLAAAGSS